MRTYLRQNWKRLVLANVVSFGLQAVAFAALAALGVDWWLSTAAAKSASWLAFAGQVGLTFLRK